MNENELPVGWVKCKLEDTLTVLSGYSGKQVKFCTNFPVTRIETISKGKIDFDRVGYVENISETYLLNRGNILFSNINSDFHLGKTAIYDNSNQLYHGTNLLRLNVNEEVLIPYFLNYYLNYLRFEGYYLKIAQHAVNQSSINQKKLKNIELLLPPLAEQKRIVGKIEELFAEVDKGIDLLKQKQAELKKYRQSVLSAAFSGKLYKTTEWQTVQLKDIFKIITGKTPSKQHPEFFGGDIPFAKPGDLDKGQYINITEDSLTKEGFSHAPFLPKGAILVSCIGNLGKKAILACDGSCNQQLNAILPTEKVNILYTYFYIDMIKPWMEKNASATTVTILNKNTFEKAPFLLPTLPEQEQIVAEIEQRFKKADILERSIADALESAEKLKQSILKKAFEGKLVPQDPTDEPASVLLERIKSEHPPKKGKKK